MHQFGVSVICLWADRRFPPRPCEFPTIGRNQMRRRRLSSRLLAAIALVALTVTLTKIASAAPKYKVLHAFSGGADGGGLWGSLLLDQQGNLYGTTSGGGAYGQGTVFELSPGSHSRWTETVLHSFPSFPNDGQGPTSSLILDTTGDLFGTTLGGGDHDSGVAFELAHDSWAESILYNFCAEPKCSDGGSPYAGLVSDNAGNLYGTAGRLRAVAGVRRLGRGGAS
jgi:uncharacterized repeat protein (TIGR03803 family)